MSNSRPRTPPDQPLLDELSRQLARASTRRDAVRVVLTMMFGGSFAAACTNATEPCGAGCKGSDGACYTCTSGTHCSQSGGSGCSTSSQGGVFCCYDSVGGGTSGGSSTCPCSRGYTYNFSSQLCCPSSTPNYYPGTHGIKPAGCYATCPYVGDCGSRFQSC